MIDVSSGSVIVVDPESLRLAALQLDAAAERLSEVESHAQEAAVQIAVDPTVSESRAWQLMGRASKAVGHINKNASDLRHAADRYEFADLRMQMSLLAAGGPDRPTRCFVDGEREKELEALSARWNELSHENPVARDQANRDWGAWRSRDDGGLETFADAVDVATWWMGRGMVPVPAPGDTLSADAQSLIGVLALGVVPVGAKLTGRGDPVAVRPVEPPGHVRPPGSLQEAAGRIPDGENAARVRVETYRMPDGTREHVLYLAGTKGGGDDAWDWGSNLDLYNGRRSASWNGVQQALDQAGVRPGDTIHELGFSQGAMLATRLATEGEYDVRSLISFGSPVDAAGLDADVLQLSVRHTDDVVPALANGGNPSQGVVVEQLYDAEDGLRDLAVPAHRLRAYAETAGEIDASRDPRLDALDELFERLRESEGADVVEFVVERER